VTVQNEDLAQGAANLVINCAGLGGHETVLIVAEDPKLGWYDAETIAIVESGVEKLGIKPTRIQVACVQNAPDARLTQAIDSHDVTIFLARLGDRSRFSDIFPGKIRVMCYARTAAMLASPFGRADYHGFVDLMSAVNAVLCGAQTLRITCPLGTDLAGKVSDTDKSAPGDVSIRRFPLGVPQPIDTSNFSGRVALARFLSPTGSRVYSPASIAIETPVMAEIAAGRITHFTGDKKTVDAVRAHHDMVARKFNIDGDILHSFHAGIHPGCAYAKSAGDDPDLWSNTVFNNPRVLHFHVCGNTAPGEISWVVIDPTVDVDGINLWEDGRLCIENFTPTKNCLDRWQDLKSLFANPARSIGI